VSWTHAQNGQRTTIKSSASSSPSSLTANSGSNSTPPSSSTSPSSSTENSQPQVGHSASTGPSTPAGRWHVANSSGGTVKFWEHAGQTTSRVVRSIVTPSNGVIVWGCRWTEEYCVEERDGNSVAEVSSGPGV